MWIILALVLLKVSFAISLEEAIKVARENNKEIKSQKILLDKAKYNLKADKNLYLPEFFINYKYSYQTQTQKLDIPFFSFSSSDKDYQSLNIGARLNIFDGGARSSKVDISIAQLNLEAHLLQEKEEDIILEVINAYLDALSTKALVEVYKDQERALTFARDRAKAFYEQGLVAITDLLHAQVKLSEAQRDLIDAQGVYKIALARLSQLLGKNVEDVEFVKAEPQIDTLEQYIQSALSNRAILSVYRESINQVKSLQKIEESKFLPKLFLQGEYVYSDQNPSLKPKGFGIISLGLALNFQGLEGYYRKLSYIEEERKLLTDLSDMEDKIVLFVKKAYQEVLTAQENLKVAKSALEFAEKFYELVQE